MSSAQEESASSSIPPAASEPDAPPLDNLPATVGDIISDAAPAAPTAKVGLTRLRRLGGMLSYTAPQQRAMIVLLCVVLAILLWRAVRNRAFIDDPQPKIPARFTELADRLDPNTATWEELVALPMLGEKRAKAIVEYRESWQKRHPGDPAFKSSIDLVAVKGIGASTADTLAPHLMFPAANVLATKPQMKP